MTVTDAASASPAPFPRVFLVANTIELFERLAFYGVYINLSVYLLSTVGFNEIEIGNLLGVFAVGRAWLPVAVGAVADRITFRVSLIIAFCLYMVAYGALYAAPTRTLAYVALVGMSIGGAFMKPVISGCVQRFSPPGRQTQGFAIFYAMVNAGSVVGKVLAREVRTLISLRATMLTSMLSSGVALLLTLFFFFEPASDTASKPREARREGDLGRAAAETLGNFGRALGKPRLAVFLLLVSGYYLLIEQFYQTFPVYMLRTLGPDAPRELITLINPLGIATLQITVARLSRRLDPLGAMSTGIAIGAVSMVTMGLYPSLWGAAGSFFIFAVAEMIFSPRYYAYVSSFAPRGQEGLYMGLALIPFGAGGLAGGLLSGRLIKRFLSATGPRDPLSIWGTYAAIGLACALALAAYRFVIRRLDAAAPRGATP